MDFEQLTSEGIDSLSKDNDVSKCILILKRAASAIPVNANEARTYIHLLEVLLEGVNTKWYQTLSESEPQLYEDFFFKWHNKEEVALLLLRIINETRPSLKLETCLILLEKFLVKKVFASMVTEQSIPHVDPMKQNFRRESWQHLISSFISLPDKIAPICNALPSNLREKFSSRNYFKLISGAAIKSLEQMHSRVQNSVDVNMEFLKSLLGRCCLAGHTDEIMSPLVQFLILKTENDFIWRRLSQKLLTGVSDQYLEPIVTFVLRKCNSFKDVQRLFGTSVMDDQRVYRLLSHKLLLVRCFQDVNILNNLLGYLSDDKFQKILVEIFFRVIDAWGNKTCVKHRQYHQHLYLTKALIISLKFINPTQMSDNKQAILQKMMNSMDAHLSSPLKPLHQIGMVTAKLICKTVDPSGPQLDFKYEEDDIALELESLLTSQTERKRSSNEPFLNEEMKQEVTSIVKSEPKLDVISTDLDSDDDLEPFDMSHDTVKLKYGKPRYLRDCIEGLLVQDDPDRIQISLENVEDLIRRNSVGLVEVAVELAKILLNMEDTCAITNFIHLRFGALVAVTVKCPKQVSTYLCEQFYAKNYNIRQRIDILEVLAGAAQELSKPRQTERLVSVVKDKSQISFKDDDWKAIVQKRVESKTRYFHKTHVRKEIIGSRNEFGSVAGCFFFPLLSSYDNRENTFDLLGSDFFLLGRLVWCLATVIHSTKNCPIAVRMGQTLLEFVTQIRYHAEPYVRRAAVFAVCEVVASIPVKQLLESLQDKIIESGEWLKETIEHDTDPECQNLAIKTLMLLDSAMKEELKSEIKESHGT